MRIQTRRMVAEQARSMRLLREALTDSLANESSLAADCVQLEQRANRAEAEAEAARGAITAGHAELLAENERLRKANKILHGIVNEAMGYGPAELAVIDAGGEKALTAAEREAAAAAVKVSAT